MKIRYLFILSVFWTLNAYGDNNAENYLDEKKYSVEDEYTYSVLLRDYRNSQILGMLGIESDNPDQAAQIEEYREHNSNKVSDAELKVCLSIGNMDMPKVKEKTIAELRKRQISLLAGRLDLESVQNAMQYYTEELDAAEKKLVTAGGLSLYDAFIDYWIFNPQIDYSLFDGGLPLPLVNTASLIAVTRFDNLKWHDRISDCMEKEDPGEQDGDVFDNILRCTEDYARAVSEEAAKISRQLLPYRSHFEMSRPMPDKSEMVKEVSPDGQSYMWKPRN